MKYSLLDICITIALLITIVIASGISTSVLLGIILAMLALWPSRKEIDNELRTTFVGSKLRFQSGAVAHRLQPNFTQLQNAFRADIQKDKQT